MISTPESSRNIEIQLAKYSSRMMKYKPTKQFVLANKYLSELPILESKLHLNPMSREQALKDTTVFFNNHFKLHSILWINSDAYYDTVINAKINSIDDLANLYNSLGKTISPIDLPIEYVPMNEFFGELNIFDGYPPIKVLLEKIKILFINISLSSHITDITPTSHIHEIIHSQLLSQSGSVKYYVNSEVLPIFLEIVAAFELDNTGNLLKTEDLYRIKHLLDCFKEMYTSDNSDDLIEANVYMSSILKAYQLFAIYYQGNKEKREQIMSRIQNIFDGVCTVEDLLDEYNITYTNSLTKTSIQKMFTR